MAGYSHRTWTCPFFTWDDMRSVHCEGGRLKFKDCTAANAFTGRYCAGGTGWKSCTVAKALLEYYDRT